jgi:hypothetical protein
VEWLANGTGDREAGDRRRLASRGLLAPDVEKSATDGATMLLGIFSALALMLADIGI